MYSEEVDGGYYLITKKGAKPDYLLPLTAPDYMRSGYGNRPPGADGKFSDHLLSECGGCGVQGAGGGMRRSLWMRK